MIDPTGHDTVEIVKELWQGYDWQSVWIEASIYAQADGPLLFGDALAGLLLFGTAIGVGAAIGKALADTKSIADSVGTATPPDPDDIRRLIRKLEKKIKSLKKQLEDHQTKLKNYKNDPLKYDNQNLLKNAATQEIWDSIYYGRIAHLETEIASFLAQIAEAEAAIEILKSVLDW